MHTDLVDEVYKSGNLGPVWIVRSIFPIKMAALHDRLHQKYEAQSLSGPSDVWIDPREFYVRTFAIDAAWSTYLVSNEHI